MSDSQTLYVRSSGTVTEREEWKRPRELRALQPGNRAELLKDDVQAQWREDRHIARNSIASGTNSADVQLLPSADVNLVAAVESALETSLIAADAPAAALVPPSKLTGGWFREDPW